MWIQDELSYEKMYTDYEQTLDQMYLAGQRMGRMFLIELRKIERVRYAH